MSNALPSVSDNLSESEMLWYDEQRSRLNTELALSISHLPIDKRFPVRRSISVQSRMDCVEVSRIHRRPIVDVEIGGNSSARWKAAQRNLSQTFIHHRRQGPSMNH